MSQHILLVEDDESLGSTLTENLVIEGYDVDWQRDGGSGLSAASKRIHNLIVLDVMLPGLSGLEILQSLRKSTQVPVLIISAKGTVQDRIAGLELKADDYLVKPFHLQEFLLRVKGLLRRTPSTETDESKLTQIQVGQALFDLPGISVRYFDSASNSQLTEKLTEKELGLLRLLLSRANQVVSRKDILDLVWGHNNYPTTRTIDNIIVRFRKWIEPDPAAPRFIISHRGIGYELKLEKIQDAAK